MTDKNNDNENNKNQYLSYGVIFGLLTGALATVIIGMFVKTPLIWTITPGIGLLIGIIIGIIMDANKNNQ